MSLVEDLKNNKLLYDGKEIFVIFDSGSNPWFKASDVLVILEYANTGKNTRRTVRKYVRKVDRLKFINFQSREPIRREQFVEPHTVFINESGLFDLISGSTVEGAIAFKHWITSEVLPSVRTYGQHRQEEDLSSKFEDLKVNCVQPTDDDKTHHYYVLIKKNRPRDKEPYPYIILRIQEKNKNSRIRAIKKEYEKAEVLLNVYDPNPINLYNRMKESGLVTRSDRNHFDTDLEENELMMQIQQLRGTRQFDKGGENQ